MSASRHKNAPKRTPTEIEAHRAAIEPLHLKYHLTQHQIAGRLGISRDMVEYDLAAMKREWEAKRTALRDQHIAEEVRRIDLMEAEYWEAWERSREDTVTLTTEALIKSNDLDLPDGVDREALDADEIKQGISVASKTVLKQIEKRTGQVGGPANMAGVQWCSEARRKLLGLDAPTKIAPTIIDGTQEYSGGVPVSEMTDDQLTAHRAAIAERLVALRAGYPDRTG